MLEPGDEKRDTRAAAGSRGSVSRGSASWPGLRTRFWCSTRLTARRAGDHAEHQAQWTALSLRRSLPVVRRLGPGDEIGGYRIEVLAGRGGMGLVYRARQRRPDRVVAIKVIAPELAADPDFRARFEQESATAAEIEHPNVIPVYEVGEEDGLLFIAMRFVQGVDLGGLLRQAGRLAPQRAGRLISQVADALDAAHAQGLVHRDVKPGNILVAAGEHVYLTDFGLTKKSSDSRGMTKTGMFVGIVDYIAPEQVEGRRVDARADVYALGCVTYEVLAGAVPFPRDSDIAKIFAHVNDTPPPLRDVPAPLAAAVMRAMAKRPEDRFQSAGDFGRAVIAGAVGRTDVGDDRTVATGAAAIADPDAPTVIAGLVPTELAVASGPPRGRPRSWALGARGTVADGRGRRRRGARARVGGKRPDHEHVEHDAHLGIRLDLDLDVDLELDQHRTPSAADSGPDLQPRQRERGTGGVGDPRGTGIVLRQLDRDRALRRVALLGRQQHL